MSQKSTQREKKQFAQRVQQAIQVAGDQTEFRYDAKAFCLVGVDGTTVDLHNAYDTFCSAIAAQRRDVVRCFVRSILARVKTHPEELEDARPDLLPALRSRASVEILTLGLDREDFASSSAFQVLAEHLAVVPCYDTPESICDLPLGQLTRWNIALDEALQLALTNLREITTTGLQHRGSGLWEGPWTDGYGASRLLLPELVHDLPVQGDPIAMVPQRDMLLVTGSQETQGLEHLLAAAEAALGRPYSVSGIALRLEGDQWTSFLPPPTHPLYQRFRKLAGLSIGQDYASQKTALQAMYQRQRKDDFVASYIMTEDPTGQFRSSCTWTEGICQVLPRTDDVVVVPEEAIRAGQVAWVCSWEQVQEVARDWFQPLGLYPERYWVEKFPGPQELKALQARGAVELKSSQATSAP